MLRNHIPIHRFAIRSCSQCGKDFGPGNSGFSHCASHSGLPTLRRAETPAEKRIKDDFDRALARQIERQHQTRTEA